MVDILQFMTDLSKPLTIKQAMYCFELVADAKENATAAYQRVYGCARTSASSESAQLMKDPRIKQLLQVLREARLRRLELTADDVVRDLYMVKTADSNELTEYRVGACRYCHGDGFAYQRTPAEFRRDLAAYLHTEKLKPLRAGEERDLLGLKFDMLGGVGFDARKNPHPDCPECFGEGIGRAIIKDTRNLSEAGRTLYTGIKQTKNGIEIMTRSKDKAIDLAARATGVVKANVELTGKNGGPIQAAVGTVTLTTVDPIEAAREYQKLMGGG